MQGQVSNFVFMTNLIENVRMTLEAESRFEGISPERKHIWVNKRLSNINILRLYNFAKSIRVRKMCRKIREKNDGRTLITLGTIFSKRFDHVFHDCDLTTVRWCLLSALYPDYGTNTSRLRP